MRNNSLDDLRSAHGKHACGHLNYRLGCVRALHLQPELLQQLKRIARDKGSGSFLQSFQRTIIPEHARRDCRKSNEAVRSSDATSTGVLVLLLREYRFESHRANNSPAKTHRHTASLLARWDFPLGRIFVVKKIVRRAVSLSQVLT